MLLYNFPDVDMLSKKCLQCSIQFNKKPHKSMKVWREEVKYCSRKCYDLSPRSEEELARLRSYVVGKKGGKHPKWKGVKAKYQAIHMWVKDRMGRPGECVYCGKENRPEKEGRSIIQWANIDHKYTRKLEDYIPLCCSCHKVYDNNLALSGR